MKELIVLVGPPGSGKSTLCEEYPDYVRVNQDDQGKAGHKQVFEKALQDGKSIVVDRMNFNEDQRSRYIYPADQQGYTVTIKVLHVPMQECLDRCKKREGHPTVKTEQDASNAVNFFFKNYERVQDHEADFVERLGWVGEDKMQAIVCDLDGTLANVEHRRHYVRGEGKPDWKNFFKEMKNDSVNEWCKELLYAMSNVYPIIYATGRPGEYKDMTLKWLDDNGLTFPGYRIFTRGRGDFRRDDVIKEIILEFEIKTRVNVLLVVDDRQQVVKMWRNHGLTVLQCDEGDF